MALLGVDDETKALEKAMDQRLDDLRSRLIQEVAKLDANDERMAEELALWKALADNVAKERP